MTVVLPIRGDAVAVTTQTTGPTHIHTRREVSATSAKRNRLLLVVSRHTPQIQEETRGCESGNLTHHASLPDTRDDANIEKGHTLQCQNDIG